MKFTAAFLAGVVSFASPCVLPLVPAYLGMLTGLSLENWAGRRWQVLGHALFFVLGFSLLFIVSGAAATALGRALYQYMTVIRQVGGVILVILGLHMLGLIRIPLLYRPRSLAVSAKPGAGYAASFLTGMVLFSGWVPCVGPVLMAIYMLAGSSTTVGQGALLLAVYSAGLAVPFLAVALFAGYLIPYLRRFSRLTRWVEMLSGILVIVIGIAIFFDTFVVLSRFTNSLGL